MNALELKIPPLAVMLLCAALMSRLATWLPAALPAMHGTAAGRMGIASGTARRLGGRGGFCRLDYPFPNHP